MINRNSCTMAASTSLVLNRIVILVMLCYPVLLLTVQGGMNGLLFLMVITSLFYLFRRPEISNNSPVGQL